MRRKHETLHRHHDTSGTRTHFAIGAFSVENSTQGHRTQQREACVGKRNIEGLLKWYYATEEARFCETLLQRCLQKLDDSCDEQMSDEELGLLSAAGNELVKQRLDLTMWSPRLHEQTV